MAKKVSYSKKELALGIPIEMEHTNKKWFAEKIAKDHLREFPNYYSKGVIPMERRLNKLGRKK